MDHLDIFEWIGINIHSKTYHNNCCATVSCQGDRVPFLKGLTFILVKCKISLLLPSRSQNKSFKREYTIKKR